MDRRHFTLPRCPVHEPQLKTHRVFKGKAEETFSACVTLVLLIMGPLWGATAMLVGSVIGLFAYALLFRRELRQRGCWTMFISLAVASAIAAVFVIAISVSRGHSL